MTKFDQIFNNIVSEEMSSQKHEMETIKHPLKDQMIGLLKKWIKEGEHQDGEAFWDNFESPNEAVEDFLRTVGHHNPQI